jgi:hypothetical protein
MDSSPETRPEDAQQHARKVHALSVAGRRRGMATWTNAPQQRAATPEPTDHTPADTEGIPEQLADMRWVYAHPAREDRTQGHKVCRKWLNADLPGFMARKSSLEAKVPPPKMHDDDYPIRLQLDNRRCNPTLNHEEMISLLIFFDDNAAIELYLTVEQWTLWCDAAHDAGLSLPDWMFGILRAGAAETLAGPLGRDAVRLSSEGHSPSQGRDGFLD